MADVEKVLAALQCIASGEYLFRYEADCLEHGCPYYEENICYRKVVKDAYDLLKDVSARVLDYDELWDEGHPKIVYVEDYACTSDIFEAKYIEEENCYEGVSSHWVLEYNSENRDNYNKKYQYRIWNKDPAENLRKETSWND